MMHLSCPNAARGNDLGSTGTVPRFPRQRGSRIAQGSTSATMPTWPSAVEPCRSYLAATSRPCHWFLPVQTFGKDHHDRQHPSLLVSSPGRSRPEDAALGLVLPWSHRQAAQGGGMGDPVRGGVPQALHGAGESAGGAPAGGGST